MFEKAIKKILKTGFGRYCASRKTKTAAILAAGFVLSAAVYFVSVNGDEAFTYDNGRLSSLRLDSGAVTLTLKGESDGSRYEKQVIIRPKRAAKEKTYELSKEDLIAAELSRTVQAVNLSASDEENVSLPSLSEGGIKLTWSRPERINAFLLPVPCAVLLVVFSYRGMKDKEKKSIKKEKAEIMKALPSFTNKLVLLMGSGLIFDDAFGRIADGYAALGTVDAFGQIVCNTENLHKSSGSDIAELLSAEAGKRNIRDFTRITALIADNRYRGQDLTGKLRNEGEILWTERRKRAEIAGKLAETKLSGPLGILLIVLILVTAAPAMMQM